jgi:hypothetical protein
MVHYRLGDRGRNCRHIAAKDEAALPANIDLSLTAFALIFPVLCFMGFSGYIGLTNFALVIQSEKNTFCPIGNC